MLYSMEALYMLYSTLYMLYGMEALYMLYSMEAELHKSAGCCTPCICCSLVYVVQYFRPCICCTVVPCICCTVWRPCICCTVWRQSCTSLLAAVRHVYVVALYMMYSILGLVYVVQYLVYVVQYLVYVVQHGGLVYVVQYGGRVAQVCWLLYALYKL